MSRVEVIVDRISDTKRNERFIEWIDGWLRSRHVVLGVYDRHNRIEVAFVLEKDMFRLFEEMYRVVEVMREVLYTDAPVAICSDDECIDLSENREETFVMIASKYKIRKLKKVRNMVKRVLTNTSLFDMGIYVASNGGRIWINTNGCRTMLYVDEAVVISEILLSSMYANTKLEILKEVADTVFKMFERTEVDLSMVDIRDIGDGFIITVGGCKLNLNYEETLKLVYEMLNWSIIGLKKSLIVADGYGI
jgi:hypothetical protein